MAKKASPKSPAADGMEEAKKAVLDRALHDIVKRYGEGSIMRLGEAHQMKVEAIPTGRFLRPCLGCWWHPQHASRIFGPESWEKPHSVTHRCRVPAREVPLLSRYEHALDLFTPPNVV